MAARRRAVLVLSIKGLDCSPSGGVKPVGMRKWLKLGFAVALGGVACSLGSGKDAPEAQSPDPVSPSTSAAPLAPAPAAPTPPEGASASDPVAVSLLELIATPERFKGRWVRLMGFAVLEFEGNAVYLHEEDYLHSLTRNAVWLDLKGSAVAQPNGPAYAIVEGRFDPDVHGHLDLFAAGLVQVQRLSPWAGGGRPKATGNVAPAAPSSASADDSAAQLP
jgi:hypothetical protein